MTVFQFVYCGTSSLCQQLVTHADTHAGAHFPFLLFCIKELLDVFHSIYCCVGVARTIGKEKSVKFKLVEIVVPWNTNHFNPTLEQTADDVVFHTAIHKHNLFALSFTIADDLLA